MSISNFVRVELQAAINDADTTITFTDAVSPFNNPPAAGTLVLTDNEWNPTAFEAVTYTGLTDNGNGTHTLTGVTRGAESTTAASWSIGAIITQPMTAQTSMLTDGSNAAAHVGIGLPDPDVALEVNGHIRSSYKSQGFGYIGLAPGWAADRTGYLQWRDGAGVRYGYMGGDISDVGVHLENGANFTVGGGDLAVGDSRYKLLEGMLRIDMGTGLNQSIGSRGGNNFEIGTRSWSDQAFINSACYDIATGDPKIVRRSASDTIPTRIQMTGANGQIQFQSATASDAAGTDVTLNTNVVISNIGRVGIGTVNPQALLHTVGAAYFQREGEADQGIKLTATISANWIYSQSSALSVKPLIFDQLNATSDSYYSFRFNGAATVAFRQDGKVGIGTATPSYKLHVVGDIYATGNITSASDIRFKTKIKSIADPIDKIKKLQGFTYQTKHDEDEVRKVGVSAQAVQKVLPEAVVEDNDGNLSVAYGNMVALLIEGMKDQQRLIEGLQSRIEAMEGA